MTDVGLWFDNQGGVHLDYPRSIRCLLGRHDNGTSGCPAAFRPLLGGGGARNCLCHCHRSQPGRPMRRGSR